MDETSVIRVRYWAAAKAAAGTSEDLLPVTGSLTLAEVRSKVAALHPGTRLPAVLDACSVLIGDQPAGARPDDEVQVAPGASVEFLPPFAGG